MSRTRSLLAIMAIALLMAAAVDAGRGNSYRKSKGSGRYPKGGRKYSKDTKPTHKSTKPTYKSTHSVDYYPKPKYVYEYKDIYIKEDYCIGSVLYKLKEILEYVSYKKIKLVLYKYKGDYKSTYTTEYVYPPKEEYENEAYYYSYGYPVKKMEMDDYMYIEEDSVYLKKELGCGYYKLSLYFLSGYKIKVYNIYFRIFDKVKDWNFKDCKYPTYNTVCYPNKWVPGIWEKNDYPYGDDKKFCSFERWYYTYPICGTVYKKYVHYDLTPDYNYKY